MAQQQNPAHDPVKCETFAREYLAPPADMPQVEKARQHRLALVRFNPAFRATFESLGLPL